MKEKHLKQSLSEWAKENGITVDPEQDNIFIGPAPSQIEPSLVEKQSEKLIIIDSMFPFINPFKLIFMEQCAMRLMIISSKLDGSFSEKYFIESSTNDGDQSYLVIKDIATGKKIHYRIDRNISTTIIKVSK